MVLHPLQAGFPDGAELLVVLFVFGLFAVVPLVAAFLTYRDADRRNSSHALAWAAGAFFGGVVVWVLYFVVRDEVGPGPGPGQGPGV